MPTKHQRIAVTNDAELREALARVERLFDGTPTARIVHDLAVEGAQVVADAERRRRDAIQWLIEWSTGDDMDRETLLCIDEAWR
jgi:hypothetical protein